MSKMLEHITQSETPSIIIGDFNSFDSKKKEPTLFHEQFNILTQDGWTHDTAQVYSTFDNRCFPYDLMFKMSESDKNMYNEYVDSCANIKVDVNRDNMIQKFRTFLMELPKRYLTVGVALDHVFSKHLHCDVCVESFPNLSDHYIVHVEF